MFGLGPLIAAELTSGVFTGWDPDHRFAVVIVGIGCMTLLLLVLGGVAAGVWSSVRVKQIEADLKRDMLDRGMSAEEVQQVIQAKPMNGFDRWISSWCKK